MCVDHLLFERYLNFMHLQIVGIKPSRCFIATLMVFISVVTLDFAPPKFLISWNSNSKINRIEQIFEVLNRKGRQKEQTTQLCYHPGKLEPLCQLWLISSPVQKEKEQLRRKNRVTLCQSFWKVGFRLLTESGNIVIYQCGSH